MVVCHIRIGGVAWCQCEPPPGFLDEATKRNINANCRQPSAADAVAFVHLLQDLGVTHASISEGLCEHDPEKNRRRAKPE